MRLNLDNTDQTLVDRVAVETSSKTWRPIRDVYLINPNDDQVKKLQSKVTPATPAGAVKVVAGVPGNLFGIFATQSPAKQQNKTYSLVSVQFDVTPSASYANTRIWITGYKGNPNAVLQTAAASGPVNFLLEATQETITITGQPVSQDGHVIDISLCLSTTVKLSGVVTAPPAPTVSQTLVSIPLGYQFAYTQLNLGATQDVIDSYRVYRNSVNNSGTASLLRVIKHDPTNASAVVVQDVTGGNQTYYYWVSSVNTVGLESTLTNAQSGAVTSGTAGLDADVSDGGVYLRTSQYLNDMLLENGNFEASSVACSATNPPPGWGVYGPGFNPTISYDTSTPFSGAQSIKIVTTGAGSSGLITSRKFAVRAGDKLFASAQAKASAGTANLALDFRNSGGSSIGGFNVTTTNAAYTLLSSSAVAPAGTVYCTIEVYGSASSTVFFDEVYLRAVRNLDTEVQDGSTFARVNTNPANGLNTGTAVASNGNLMLKNVAVQNGSTSGPIAPTTTSVIPDMTKTITTKGNPVTVNFTSTLSCLIAGSTLTYALYRDGVAVTSNYVATFQSVSDVINISITYTDPNPSAASHTYDIRWASGGSNQYQAAGTSRGFTVNEMG